MDVAEIDGPAVRFEAYNRGPSEHELEIVAPDGRPVGKIGAMSARENGSMAKNLPPGRYTAQCLVPEGSKNHKDLGMVQDFTVK